ncbi:hypothetical protein [Allostreptomyces psammosilenae]|uniref:Uncharacterized protein n=1 Tax=Allostreptomyces psammosilenae TaxID=1892865 RepID=A0A852ZWB3_9ACTN|nr:hypothetical protein [Allostreptomyces psammosilenae]NYI05540.1 hypothetical protein [Allostreptomyces psammosilenae]
MPSSRTRLEDWWAKTGNFLWPDKDEIYKRCVKAALDEPKTARLLGKRPGVTSVTVRAQMQRASYVQFTTSLCEGETQTAFDRACANLVEIQDLHQRAASDTQWNWWVTCLLVVVVSLVVLAAGGLLALAVAVLAVAAVLFALFWVGTVVWYNLRQSLVAGAWGFAWLAQRVVVGIHAVRWSETLRKQGTGPVVAQLVRHMLGEDPDSLFIPGSYDGLRAPRAPGYVIVNGAARKLQRKISQVEYGTIAVCGPRGAGKTTLLEQCVKDADFGLLAQAPATYTPHDFLLSLSVRLCETHIRSEGYEVPQLTRLSSVQYLLRRARLRASRLGRWGAFAVPSAVLVVLGLSASVRSLYVEYASSLASFARMQAQLMRDHSMEIWQGHAIAASVTVTIAGMAWWRARHAVWLPRLIGRVWALGTTFLGAGMALVSVASVFFDGQLRQLVRHVQPNTTFQFLVLLGVWLACCLARDSGSEFLVGRWRIALEAVFRPVVVLVGVIVLLFLVQDSQTRALLADAENPLRLAAMVVGSLLMRAGVWSPRPVEPELVTQCRNHLYRLQTIQTAMNTLSAGSSQVLSLGSAHTMSVSTIPPNFPELVDGFRNLLTRLAIEKARQGKTVVIAIDEVDRLGSDVQALAFLSEIKAILGVPHVYYLISVAEDVGATFVRRGLPQRDVTDSSLDDIVYVQPSTLQESREILTRRSEALTEPYVILAHALSGGILRDLLRYGLQIREMQEKAQSFELADISRNLILEELSETLAGFRILLSKRQWTRETSDILSAFHALVGYLRDSCACTEAKLRPALERFAFYAAGDREAPVRGEVADDVRQLIDEAAAYAYFSLTLLDIFSTEGLKRRTRQAAEQGLAGAPERLADARQELGISPYSARPLIDSIRRAWSLPLGLTTNGRVPPPRTQRCSVHWVPPDSQGASVMG